MAQFEIIMPKMGESIEEATITKWFINEGDVIEEDDVLLEIATDKVDSEIPSPVAGKVKKIMFKQDETVPVGTVIAIIDLGGEETSEEEVDEQVTPEKKSLKDDEKSGSPEDDSEVAVTAETEDEKEEEEEEDLDDQQKEDKGLSKKSSDRFYSPLVRKIADEEKITLKELDKLKGSGANGRVQKKDLLEYIEDKKSGKKDLAVSSETRKEPEQERVSDRKTESKVSASVSTDDKVVEMDRVRKIISEHMIRSKQTSAHVTNMLECDVTNVVNWRNKIKDEFQRREGQKITYLPIFLEAAGKAIKDFPMINSSVDGTKIIIKKRINMGVAVSLENFNLIVPVIKNIDNLSLTGVTKELKRLATDARTGKLKPDDIADGTFTVTNFGSFGNTIGTPIINQPQVAILAVGAIEKKPAVLETPDGDVIAIRHKMYLSLTYDHRIIDGSLGGAFLKKIADYIEGFDTSREI